MSLRLFFTLAITLALLASAGADESCEYYARKLGQPLDGWRYAYDTGSPRCVRQVLDLGCPGEQYYHPVSITSRPASIQNNELPVQDTRAAGCCDLTATLTWFDKDARLGYVSFTIYAYFDQPLMCPWGSAAQQNTSGLVTLLLVKVVAARWVSAWLMANAKILPPLRVNHRWVIPADVMLKLPLLQTRKRSYHYQPFLSISASVTETAIS